MNRRASDQNRSHVSVCALRQAVAIGEKNNARSAESAKCLTKYSDNRAGRAAALRVCALEQDTSSQILILKLNSKPKCYMVCV